jgi:hypothetical protein
MKCAHGPGLGSWWGISRPPLISNVVINGGADVTDGQVAAGSIGVSLNLHAPAGIETTIRCGRCFHPISIL